MADLRAGFGGCVGRLCRRHDALPGARIDAFIGGNIRGYVDLGLQGGWGNIYSRLPPGMDGLALYGIDIDRLPPQATEVVDLSRFRIREAALDTANAGFAVRAHFLPNGRWDPWIGTGVGWRLLRARYELAVGEVVLAYHGIDVPAQVGLNYFFNSNVALGVQADFSYVWYGLVSLTGSLGNFTAPVEVLEQRAGDGVVELTEDLPMWWSFGAVLHTRFGR